MKKVAKNQANKRVIRKLDTVGVDGSIPSGPTIKLHLDNTKSYVIPDGFEAVTTIEWIDFSPKALTVIRRVHTSRRGKAVESTADRRRA